ncbi:MAG: hypothetical protein M2R45_01201 [Verrucomicrobia subdivision 3 bacterium]|nr:hypothetical protein [Limisphaerales bacterium]MCS1415247.1 hypothetical protein [Limisphaerales bacterium]
MQQSGSTRENQRRDVVSLWTALGRFANMHKSGAWGSRLFPGVASRADDLAFIKGGPRLERSLWRRFAQNPHGDRPRS